MRVTTGLYSAIHFFNRAPEWIFLRVGLDNLPGIGRGKNYWESQIHKLGLTIKNAIGKFSGVVWVKC